VPPEQPWDADARQEAAFALRATVREVISASRDLRRVSRDVVQRAQALRDDLARQRVPGPPERASRVEDVDPTA